MMLTLQLQDAHLAVRTGFSVKMLTQTLKESKKTVQSETKQVAVNQSTLEFAQKSRK